MKSLDSLERETVRGLQGVLFDLDDTLLTRGVLTRPAFEALWDLHDAGLILVAVTGRPASWGEVLVRQWPLAGAVTENGGAHVVRDGAGVRVDLPARAERGRLDALVLEVEREVPAAWLSDDAHGRLTDVTWDIGERRFISPAAIDVVSTLALRRGARITRSTVHLHATFSPFDKASGVVRFLSETLGVDATSALQRFAFVGDSGNDAPCFAAFRTTLAVANVRAHVGEMSVPPRFVAQAERGAGFAEIAAALLSKRAGP